MKTMRKETETETMSARLTNDGLVEFLIFYKETATKQESAEFARQLLEMCEEE